MKKILLILLFLNSIYTNAQIDGDPDIGDLTAPGVFYDKFESALDTTVWEIHNTVWGQPTDTTYQHGGVITENCYTENGFAVMRSLGDYYTGSLTGTNGRSTRIGGAMHTTETFASGRFEIKMKALQRPNMGVLTSPWTYRYETVTLTDDPVAYNKALSKGADASNNSIGINSEIDIELKGTNLANPIMKHWLTVQRSAGGDTQLPVNLNDNEFHVYRWDWHTGGHGETERVEYYVDDVLYSTITEYVPYMSAKMTMGNWFAWWASLDLDGTYQAPLYDTDYVYVDWVKITPFYEAEDDWFRTEGQRAYPDWVAHKIPGTIDAINFDRGGSGVAYYDTTTNNSGDGIRDSDDVDTNTNGSIESMATGEWVEYTTHIEDDALYDISFEIASANNNPGSFRLEIDGTDVTGTLSAIATGGNLIFQTKELTDVNLTNGQHIVRFYVVEGGFNLQSISFTTETIQSPYPDSNAPHAIPGAIVSTNFDEGGEGFAYYDATTGNTGSGPRQTENVDTAYDDNGDSVIGWGSAGEWQEYTVNVDQSGDYSAVIRVASAAATPGSFRIDIDGTDVSGSVNAITTGSWTSYQEVTVNNISLTVGQHVLRFNNVTSGFNWSKMTFTNQSPYPDSSTPNAIPGEIVSTNFDEGGEGFAYYDTTTGNTGSGPRQTENVDTSYDDNGAPVIGWGSAGEWQEYTINVDQSGYYSAVVRVASAATTPGSFSIDIDGTNISGSVNAITTGSWTSYQEVTINNLSLTIGQHILRFNNVTSGFNWSKITFTFTGTSILSKSLNKLSNAEENKEDFILHIYPNPISYGILNIDSDTKLSLKIYTFSGLEIFNTEIKSGLNNINLSSLASGIYLIHVTNNKGYRKVEKLVVF